VSCRVPVVQTAGEFDHEPTDITVLRGERGDRPRCGRGRQDLRQSEAALSSIVLSRFFLFRLVGVTPYPSVPACWCMASSSVESGAGSSRTAIRRRHPWHINPVLGNVGMLLLRLRRFGDRGRRGVWVVLALRPDVAAGVAAVVVDDGVPTGSIQQAPWFVAFRTTSNRHRGEGTRSYTECNDDVNKLGRNAVFRLAYLGCWSGYRSRVSIDGRRGWRLLDALLGRHRTLLKS